MMTIDSSQEGDENDRI
jgi:hypothetical protein